jgi:NAD(P)-dependent dehydrogenase (short-subunit alcohol dehydrogenase family)
MFDLSWFSLEGKVAVVTGGSRGIGQAIALGFAKAGATVVVTSRKIKDLEETAAQIKAFGGQALPIQAHLGKIPEIKKMVDTVMSTLRPHRYPGQQCRRQPGHGIGARFRGAALGHHHEPEHEGALLPQPGGRPAS